MGLDRGKYIKLLDESVKKVVEELKGKAEKIMIFGSYPERKDLLSDLDVVVVMQTDKPFIERLREIYSYLALPVDADILWYTPEEFERVKGKPMFRKARVIYERRWAEQD